VTSKISLDVLEDIFGLRGDVFEEHEDSTVFYVRLDRDGIKAMGMYFRDSL
jgi:hypothetical protein